MQCEDQMLVTRKPHHKRIHLTFRDPVEKRSKTVTFYDVTLEEAMERTVKSSPAPRPRRRVPA